jgi:transcriptional regulator GlxA family with amidase domain
MADPSRPHAIGILAYPGAQPAAVYGLTDLLETANRLHLDRGGGAPPTGHHGARPPPPPQLDVQPWRELDGLPKPRAPLAAIILPPSVEGVPPRGRATRLAGWLIERHREGSLLCSVCVGGFVLAETGLLAGRPATTHWALRDQFVERFPDIQLDTDRLLIDDGDLITAGGFMAWVDLGLRLVDRFLGPTVMLATARYFLVDPGGREQRFYKTFAPATTHGDEAILKAQHWLEARAGDKLTLPMMARKAGLGERTFLRRFVSATTLRPTEYLQHLRVRKARDLLERKAMTVSEVAWRVGYEDPNAFRKIFLRVLGLSPGEYRRRFGVTR